MLFRSLCVGRSPGAASPPSKRQAMRQVSPAPWHDARCPSVCVGSLARIVTVAASRAMVGCVTGRVRADTFQEAQSQCYAHATSPMRPTCCRASTALQYCHAAMLPLLPSCSRESVTSRGVCAVRRFWETAWRECSARMTYHRRAVGVTSCARSLAAERSQKPSRGFLAWPGVACVDCMC